MHRPQPACDAGTADADRMGAPGGAPRARNPESRNGRRAALLFPAWHSSERTLLPLAAIGVTARAPRRAPLVAASNPFDLFVARAAALASAVAASERTVAGAVGDTDRC